MNNKAQEQRLRTFIKQSELFAQYWMASASNGHATRRKIYKGGLPEFGGKLSTKEELVDNAMAIAKQHIENMIEASGRLAKLLEKR